MFSLAWDMDTMVRDYWVPVGEGGVWNVDLRRRLNDWELDSMANLLGLIDHHRLRLDMDDLLPWTSSRDGKFSSKSCREARWIGERVELICLDIWRYRIPSKVAFIMWTAVRGHLPTIDLLQNRGMVIPNACPLDLQDAESMNRIFLHCPFAAEIWELFLNEIGLAWVFPKELDVLIYSWKLWLVPKNGGILWKLICLAVCWAKWLERNLRVFENCRELAFIVFLKAKDLVCFWGQNCPLSGEYSFASMKREWLSFFTCT